MTIPGVTFSIHQEGNRRHKSEAKDFQDDGHSIDQAGSGTKNRWSDNQEVDRRMIKRPQDRFGYSGYND